MTFNPTRKKLIRKHNILNGIPYKKRYRPKLILLDPPYWSQKKGEYSKDPNNLANLDIKDYYSAMEKIIAGCKRLLEEGSYVALIIGPSQVAGKIYDHVYEFYKSLSKYFSFENRIIVPYTTQQVSAAEVSQAKKDKFMLKKYRDLLIFGK